MYRRCYNFLCRPSSYKSSAGNNLKKTDRIKLWIFAFPEQDTEFLRQVKNVLQPFYFPVTDYEGALKTKNVKALYLNHCGNYHGIINHANSHTLQKTLPNINMALTAGIVGLPNVGKSTLFNAITKTKVLAANYPFATIEPNVGVVEVKDSRLDFLAKM